MSSLECPRFLVSALATCTSRPTMHQLTSDAHDAAASLVHGRLLEPYAAGKIAKTFAENTPLSRVFIEHALRAEVADSIATELLTAAFIPHHHAPYPLHIAPLRSIDPTTILGRFTAWLKSPAAAAYHVSLVGLSSLPRSISSAWIQVQVARMTTGQFFPVHVDTDEEGLTCVYQFTRGYDESDGGRLFLGSDEQTAEFVVSPVFGSLFMFRPQNARHGVSPVRALPERPRFTVTAFYLYGR